MEAKTISIEDYISAISRLFIYATNKRQLLKSVDISFNDEIGLISKEINENVNKSIGVNIFESNSVSEINNYEIELNQLFTKYTDDNIIESNELEDEIVLLRSYEIVERDYFSKRKLTINKENNDKFIKQLPVSFPSIISAVYKPDFLHLINEIDGRNNYFGTSTIGNKLLVFHLSHHREKKDTIDINTVLVFNISRYRDIYSNPTRTFLNVLDDYGIDLTIANITKRFFKYVKLFNENIKGDLKFIEGHNTGKDSFTIRAEFMKTTYGGKVWYAYGINNTIYERENLKKNKA